MKKVKDNLPGKTPKILFYIVPRYLNDAQKEEEKNQEK